MRIVHASDWHGRLIELPEADAYVFTGDMLPNHPIASGHPRRMSIDPGFEARMQSKWLSDLGHPHRSLLKSPDAPILCVRGNHDFIPAAEMFPGANVTEFIANELIEIMGKRVTGHRGIPWIHGQWSDETHRPDLIDRMRGMPQADIYLTHYPPRGILDDMSLLKEHPMHLGLEEMAYQLAKRSLPTTWLLDRDLGEQPPTALHLFGHIHERGGMTERISTVLFSNAATTFNVIDL